MNEPDLDDHMNIIVSGEDSLYALVVDEILDVIEVEQDSFEDIPETIDGNVKKFIKGVYKLKDKLIILLDLEKILTIDE